MMKVCNLVAHDLCVLAADWQAIFVQLKKCERASEFNFKTAARDPVVAN